MESCSKIIPLSTIYGTKRRRLLLEDSTDCMVAFSNDIIKLILYKLDIVSFHYFGSVCNSWRSIAIAAKKRQPSYLYPQLSSLMLSSSTSRAHQHNHHRLFNLSHRKILKVKLLATCRAQCCGSSWGWFIMEGEEGNVFILNPLNDGIQIQLPTRRSDVEVIRKAILLSPPTTTSDCVVVMINSNGSLSFSRLGDEVWTDIYECYGWIDKDDYEDIIFYDGKVYAITYYLQLVHAELDPCTPKHESCDIEFFGSEGSEEKAVYLVECMGELLMVIRLWTRDGLEDYPKLRTKMFKIFKLDTKEIVSDEDCNDRGVFHLEDKSFKPFILDNAFPPGFASSCSTPIL
ncbi:uncharacterized protein LOC122659410 [Telopea speciosissima]|uniref:uncharacterized protein LOC122659410 n=1 Tax=Telopea speciosissima TaxID=54955 RepID=UPI001CC64BE2|nr:uncharacterized protein LOC122659410 [Telopea speciosissima]